MLETQPAVASPPATRRLPGPRADVWTWVLLVAVLLGGVLRFVGIRWGLPTLLHPDEWVVVDGAIDMATRNSFEPGYFLRPDHVEIKLSYLAYVVFSHLTAGVPAETAFATDHTPFYLISRAITALFGTATIVLAYLVGRRHSRSAGALTALGVALFPPFVEHSHYATPDVPLTFALLGLVLFCMQYLERPGWRPLLLAAAAVAVAIAVKYPGAVGSLLIALVVTAAALRDRAGWRFLAHGAGAVVGVIGALFAISPVLFTNVQGVAAALGKESRTGHLGADGLGWGGNLAFYVSEFAGAAGLVVVASAVAGGVYVLQPQRRLATLPLWVGAVYWVVLSALSLHWARWGLPMYLTPLLLAPIGLVQCARALQARRARVGRPLLAAAAGVSVLGLLLGSVTATARLVADDTRVAAADDLVALGVDPSTAVFEGYTPLLPHGPRQVFGSFREVDGELVPQGDAVDKRFLVLSSDMFGRYQSDERYETEQRFYAQVERQLPRVVTVEPVPAPPRQPLEVLRILDAVRHLIALAGGANPGPEIRVHEIRSGRG